MNDVREYDAKVEGSRPTRPPRQVVIPAWHTAELSDAEILDLAPLSLRNSRNEQVLVQFARDVIRDEHAHTRLVALQQLKLLEEAWRDNPSGRQALAEAAALMARI